MKKICLFLLLLALLAGCSAEKKYTAYSYDTFDTVVAFTAYAESAEAFEKYRELAFSALAEYDALFDIYEHHDGVTNLYDVNHSPDIEVPPEISDLLACCYDAYDLTEGKVNFAMGAVLSLWHDARESGVLPERQALLAAAEHCDPATVRVENGRVLRSDELVKLDVGAVAKGYACEKIAEKLQEAGCENFILSAGGNVVTRGSSAGRAWVVGVQDPDSADILTTVDMKNGAAVTSGGYNRFAEIGGVRYHHIIDAQTLMPADKMKSVTVLADSSALADVLSTYLFQLEPEEALQRASELGVKIIVIDRENNILRSE